MTDTAEIGLRTGGQQTGVPAWLASRNAWLLVLRFGAVGLLNTAFGYAVFAALVLSGLGPGAALGLATLTGATFNFQTSRRLVFRSAGRVVRFALTYAGLLALNWGALHGLIGLGVPELAAQALLTLPFAALSFVLQKVVVFGLVAKRP